MKLKYYLRGLGIGIVVTAVIMMVALGNKQPMTDEEVIARAKELGMIENSVLTDIADKEKEPVSENNKDENSDVGQELQQDEQQDAKQEVQQDEKQDVEQELQQDEQQDDKQPVQETTDTESSDKDTITITVVGGDSSWSVSKRMEEAGLIESAKDFDSHLCKNGYDKRISVGTYEIPTSATYEEMAKIITRMN